MNQQVDLFDGERIELKELAKREHVHYSTCWRWALKGISGVRLPTRRLGNKRWTTQEAIEWWSNRITAAADGTPAPVTSNGREKQIAAAERELAKMGI